MNRIQADSSVCGDFVMTYSVYLSWKDAYLSWDLNKIPLDSIAVLAAMGGVVVARKSRMAKSVQYSN